MPSACGVCAVQGRAVGPNGAQCLTEDRLMRDSTLVATVLGLLLAVLLLAPPAEAISFDLARVADLNTAIPNGTGNAPQDVQAASCAPRLASSVSTSSTISVNSTSPSGRRIPRCNATAGTESIRSRNAIAIAIH